MGGQCWRNGRSAMDGYYVQSSLNKGNQEITEGMSFEDGLRRLKAKLDVITVKVQLDTIMYEIEQKRNINAFNSNHMICNLCGGHHATQHVCKHKMWIIMMNLGITILILINMMLIWAILMLMVSMC